MRYFPVFKQAVETMISQPDHVVLLRHYYRWKRQLAKDGSIEEMMKTARSYISQHLPAPEQICASTLAPDCDMHRLEQWMKKNKVPYQDTLYGLFIAQSTAKDLSARLAEERPLYPLFESICIQCHIPSTPENFFHFKKKVPAKMLYSTGHHPLYPEYRDFFRKSDHTAIAANIERWCILQNADLPPTQPGYCSLSATASNWNMSPDQFLCWLENHTAQFMTIDGQIIIRQDFIDQLSSRKERISPLSVLFDRVIPIYNKTKKSAMKTFLLKQLEGSCYPWLVNTHDIPGIAPLKYFWTDYEYIATHSLKALVNEYPQHPLKDLEAVTQLPLVRLQELVKQGHITAECRRGSYWLSNAEYDTISQHCSAFVALDDVILCILQHCDSRFNIAYIDHRTDLLNYLKMSDLWGILQKSTNACLLCTKLLGFILPREIIPALTEYCSLWLETYNLSSTEKSVFLLNKIAERYPLTANSLQAFLKDVGFGKSVADMLLRIFFCLKKSKKELNSCSEAEIETIYVKAFCSETIASATLFSDFLLSAEYTTKSYTFDSTGYHPDISAYPLDSFAVMVASVVNDEFCEENNLIEKAVANPKYASLWLYFVLHVLAAWRTTDYTRLPPPMLKWSPEETLRRFQNQTFTDSDAIYTAETFIARVEMRRMRPNKTKRAGNTPPLYIFCPESCKVPFGKILAIAAAHQLLTGQSHFVRPVRDILSITRFFGKEMTAACGNRPFSGRRANKSLMQAIDQFSMKDGKASAYTAYVLVSLVRAHKSAYGTLAEMTARYLRDANFSGYTPEYIVWQMMERGVCSFMADHLLEECYGETYRQLTVSDKTEVIQLVGLPAVHLDNIVRCIQQAELDAIQSLRLVKETPGCSAPKDILRSIANGHAPGKQHNDICLCTAASLPCREPARRDCLGCRFEVKSKAVLLQYLHNHIRLASTVQNTECKNISTKTQRAVWLLQNSINPAIAEIMAFFKKSASAEEFAAYADIIQERMTLDVSKQHR